MRSSFFVNRVDPITESRCNAVEVFITYRLYRGDGRQEFFFVFDHVGNLIKGFLLVSQSQSEVVELGCHAFDQVCFTHCLHQSNLPGLFHFPDPGAVRNRFGFENRAVNSIVAVLYFIHLQLQLLQPLLEYAVVLRQVFILLAQEFLLRRINILESNGYNDEAGYRRSHHKTYHTQ